jgi:hypothetical protein
MKRNPLDRTYRTLIFPTLVVDCDLSVTGCADAIELYQMIYDESPTTLICSLTDATVLDYLKQQPLEDMRQRDKLELIRASIKHYSAIAGFPKDAWAVTGDGGMVMVLGA